MNNNKKAASVWLSYLDGWSKKQDENTPVSDSHIGLPIADDYIRQRCVDIFNKYGKKIAKNIAFRIGYEGASLKYVYCSYYRKADVTKEDKETDL